MYVCEFHYFVTFLVTNKAAVKASLHMKQTLTTCIIVPCLLWYKSNVFLCCLATKHFLIVCATIIYNPDKVIRGVNSHNILLYFMKEL